MVSLQAVRKVLPLGERVWPFLQKVAVELPCDPLGTFPGLHPGLESGLSRRVSCAVKPYHSATKSNKIQIIQTQERSMLTMATQPISPRSPPSRTWPAQPHCGLGVRILGRGQVSRVRCEYGHFSGVPTAHLGAWKRDWDKYPAPVQEGARLRDGLAKEPTSQRPRGRGRAGASGLSWHGDPASTPRTAETYNRKRDG